MRCKNGGVRQLTINLCSSSMIIEKITLCDWKAWTHQNKSINQDIINVPKVNEQRMGDHVNKNFVFYFIYVIYSLMI